MNELLKEARWHYEQLPPHAKDRITSIIFKKMIDALENQWQPIETAPLDGDVVDIWMNDKRICNVWWDGELMKWRKGLATFENPTHWQTLPQPPKQ